VLTGILVAIDVFSDHVLVGVSCILCTHLQLFSWWVKVLAMF